jgi:hypothetical protein
VDLHNDRISVEDADRQMATAAEILRRLEHQPGVVLADEVGMGKRPSSPSRSRSRSWRRPAVPVRWWSWSRPASRKSGPASGTSSARNASSPAAGPCALAPHR